MVGVAQRLERPAVTRKVEGSNPFTYPSSKHGRFIISRLWISPLKSYIKIKPDLPVTLAEQYYQCSAEVNNQRCGVLND